MLRSTAVALLAGGAAAHSNLIYPKPRNAVDSLISEAVGAGATVLVSSHELERVRSLSPRVVTVAAGMVVADSSSGDSATEGDGEQGGGPGA